MMKARIALAFAAVLSLASLALAGRLEELRAAGTVGERFDGLVVARAKDITDEVKKEVAAINDKRREIYRKRATDEGVPEEQVGRVYAQEIFDKAAAGTWFLRESGDWVQKPAPK